MTCLLGISVKPIDAIPFQCYLDKRDRMLRKEAKVRGTNLSVVSKDVDLYLTIEKSKTEANVKPFIQYK